MSVLVKIADLDLANKRILIREDYNVPLKNGEVADDTRIRASLPTLKILLDGDAKVIVISHLSRPTEGRFDADLSLAPVAACLSKLLGREVPLVRDWLDGVDMEAHDIVLCENVRFEIGERENADDLARKMAALCSIYVNDAFATAHRAQASTQGVAKYAPVAAAGPLLIAELKSLSRAMKQPEPPMAAVVGGAKVSSKLLLLSSLLEKVDCLIPGGGIANTFLKAAGFPIGQSLHEAELVPEAERLLEIARGDSVEIMLPTDVVCAKTFAADSESQAKPVNAVTEDDLIMDIGDQSIACFTARLHEAKTIIWNGPMGVFEFHPFARGTVAIAQAIAASDAFSIAGGGDTLAAMTQSNIGADAISYVSTGGGAFLEFIEGRKLPAVAILEEAARAWKAMERAREY